MDRQQYDNLEDAVVLDEGSIFHRGLISYGM